MNASFAVARCLRLTEREPCVLESLEDAERLVEVEDDAMRHRVVIGFIRWHSVSLTTASDNPGRHGWNER